MAAHIYKYIYKLMYVRLLCTCEAETALATVEKKRALLKILGASVLHQRVE
jgi:hypothetical protein